MNNTDELLHQTRRLETACSIIQDIHSSLSIEDVLDSIVKNLVDVGGFAGAEIAVDATVDTYKLQHAVKAGSAAASEALTRHTPVFVRGIEVGTLTTHYHTVENGAEKREFLEFLLPTMFMG